MHWLGLLTCWQCRIQMHFGTIWTVWVPKKMHPKSSCNSYLFHIKTKWNSLHTLKTKIFSRDTNILSQMHWTSNISGPSTTTIEGFWVSINYPILNFKKNGMPKKRLDAALAGNLIFCQNLFQIGIRYNESIAKIFFFGPHVHFPWNRPSW